MCKEHLVLKYIMIQSAKKDVSLFFFNIFIYFFYIFAFNWHDSWERQENGKQREGEWHVAKGHPIWDSNQGQVQRGLWSLHTGHLLKSHY